MRRWWAAAAAVALVAGGAAAAPLTPAAAATAQDACGETGNAREDLSAATFEFSATSFRVSTTACGTAMTTSVVTVHLTSFSPEVRLAGALEDIGKYLAWSGYHACAASDCPTQDPRLVAPIAPAGPQLDGECLNDSVYPCPTGTLSGYGAWADVLPAGTAVPDTISWYADVNGYSPDTGQFTALRDRLPDTGTITSTRNAATVPTQVTAAAGPTATWSAYGAVRTDTGRLTTGDGQPVPARLVRVTPVRYLSVRRESTDTGAWSTSYAVSRNTLVQPYFAGDGVHDPVRGAAYMAYVKAFVSLDLPQSSTVRRGSPVRLRGVVRPRESGQVQVLVREDRPGTTYRLLRYTSLVQADSDSYYVTTWKPLVRGRYVLRARWNGGSTAAGAVRSNVSDYRIVTVT